jgi:hypothetical protein
MVVKNELIIAININTGFDCTQNTINDLISYIEVKMTYTREKTVIEGRDIEGQMTQINYTTVTFMMWHCIF